MGVIFDHRRGNHYRGGIASAFGLAGIADLVHERIAKGGPRSHFSGDTLVIMGAGDLRQSRAVYWQRRRSFIRRQNPFDRECRRDGVFF